MAPGLMAVNNLLISEASNHKNLHQDSPSPKVYEYSTKKKPYVHTEYTYRYKWLNIFVHLYVHLTLVYQIYLHLTVIKWITMAYCWSFGLLCGMGITAGSHRLWAHKAYKAKWPLRVLLAFGHATCNQTSIHKWVRDHRTHHKFSETDADPQNSKRGFFYSHIGWLLITKHPDVLEKGKSIDMSDIESDPIAMFQSKYYDILAPLCCFVVPAVIPWYLWNEDLWVTFHAVSLLKFVITANATWFINSFAHAKGMQPYDVNEAGTQHIVLNYVTVGEGWHNYHHAFPWDYASSEFGEKVFNVTTAFIDFCADIGLAYDRKKVPLDVVKRRVLRCGDGSHPFSKGQDHLWGWGDKDMLEEDRQYAEVFNNN